jgi:hypothetical protein
MQSPYVAGAKVAAYPVAGDEPPAVTFPLPVEDAPEPVVFVAIPDERAALIECLSEGGHDPTGWVPSQSVDIDDGRLLLASKGDELAACYDTGQSGYTFTAVTAQAGPAALVRGLPTVALPRQPIAGHTTPNAVIAELYFGDNVVRAPVINSLFLLVPPSDTRLTKVRLLDGNGTLLWDGPLR